MTGMTATGTTSRTEIADVLARAADLITERGRATDRYVSAGGALCPLGAIAVASGLAPDVWADTEIHGTTDFRVAVLAALAVAEHLGCRFAVADVEWIVRVLGAWSDRHDTTVVVDTLSAAAAYVREQVAE